MRWQRRWYRSAHAPVFVGRFTVVGGRQSLVGVLRFSRPAQISLAATLGFLLLCTLIVLPATLLGVAEPGAEWGLLVLLFFWIAALGELYVAWWRGRRDRAEIEKRLREALSPVAA